MMARTAVLAAPALIRGTAFAAQQSCEAVLLDLIPTK
jgi:hypothetical protein